MATEPHTKEPVVENTITWVGLDAHKSFINVAVLNSTPGPLLEWRTEHTRTKAKRLARKLEKLADGAEVRVCYEAGPCGWALKRLLEEAAEVVALADRAMRRLHVVYWRLTHKGKHHNVAVTACAREFVGFIWALMHPAGVGAMASRSS